ncbi:hypothetical protein [Pantoea sp. MT58]|uniref:hypothetical protein n=1 Tax=Pantoea sp. MT58 TaxID=2768165 RepID=UPI00165C7390|nr:hypothetical protein [Pantoea sp. MT58]QNQ59738.1 hypothetical protein IAI47_05695 [Pantoea sp. MT58]
MSWHHGDYINLISSIGGLGSAVFAAYATYQARKSTEISKMSLIRSERQSEVSRLMDELVRFAERCNLCLGEDGHVKENIESINEVVAACHYAFLAIENSGLDKKDIDLLIQFFIRQLRPGINGEFEHGYVVLKLGMAKTDKDLRTLYRRIQGYLDLDDPVDIPEPGNI